MIFMYFSLWKKKETKKKEGKKRQTKEKREKRREKKEKREKKKERREKKRKKKEKKEKREKKTRARSAGATENYGPGRKNLRERKWGGAVNVRDR